MLLAIEGIDGAGKGTLCGELLALAEAAGVRAAALSFPRYEETRFSELVGAYLRGDMGAIDQVPVRYAALLFGGDRFESRGKLMTLIADHDLIILDRYVSSNIAYNAAKLSGVARAELIAWIEPDTASDEVQNVRLGRFAGSRFCKLVGTANSKSS